MINTLKSKQNIFLAVLIPVTIFVVFSFRGVLENQKKMSKALAISTGIIIAPKYNDTYKSPPAFESFSYEYWQSHTPFERAISMTEHAKFMDLLEISGKIFGQKRMEYFLNLGTLIGTILTH